MKTVAVEILVILLSLALTSARFNQPANNQPAGLCNDGIQKCVQACATYRTDKTIGCCDLEGKTGNCYCCPLDSNINCATVQDPSAGNCRFQNCDVYGSFQGYPAACPSKDGTSFLDKFITRA